MILIGRLQHASKACFGVAAAALLAAAVAARAEPIPYVPLWSVPQAHRVGEVLNYSLHGEIAQTIKARDRFGRRFNQPAVATRINGRERIKFKQASPSSLLLDRRGSVVAVVAGKAAMRPGSALTLLDASGAIVRDDGKLAGMFLLPLPFLANRAMNGGAELSVGDRFARPLHIKLFGMKDSPTMTYVVAAMQPATGLYTLTATGSAPIKELTVANDGTALGYGVGRAQITLRCEYDRQNLRLRSLMLDLRDSLKLIDAARKKIGIVKDAQHYIITLTR